MKIIEKKILQQINDSLEPLDDCLTDQFKEPELPTVIILAQPRGGSTLLQQILGTFTDVGYVTNFLAQFWAAPFIGTQFEQAICDRNFRSNFRSCYGKTSGSSEPHEWGWFWKKWLNLDDTSDYITQADKINWHKLNKKLSAIQFFKESPIIFDNVFAGANLDVLYKNIPNILVINLQRNLFFVCNSLINARIERHGDISAHYGNRPRLNPNALGTDDPIEQIVYQVAATESEFEKNLAVIPARNIHKINYEDLTSEPEKIIIGFEKFLARHRWQLSSKNSDFGFHTKSRNDRGLINKNHHKKLKEVFSECFPDVMLPSI